MQKKNKLYVLIACLLMVFVFPLSAQAADPVPGDACTIPNAFFQSGGPENAGVVYFMTCQGGVWVDIYTTDTAGQVGIGTSSPAALLHLSGGQMMVDDDGSAGSQGCIKYNGGTSKLQYSHDCSSYSDLGSGGGGSSLWTVGSGDDIYYNSGSPQVGIGMTNPDVTLDVTGDIEFTGSITDMSDRRLKKDIINLPNGQLEKILALQGVSFRMKDDPKGKIEFGFIAQDVQPLFPELIKTDPDGMLSLNYMGMIAPMAEAIQEQQAIIDAQNKTIDEQNRTMQLHKVLLDIH